MQHKGIILTAGKGTRLWPVTLSINKQMLPIYDKPMIYYPLTQLMEAGIRDVLIITAPYDLEQYQQLLHDGSQWGINISYDVQEVLLGISDAFIIGENFIGNDNIMLILGDNIFYGGDLNLHLKKTVQKTSGATVFAYYVEDPSRYGVVTLDETGKAIAIEEKPIKPQSRYAVTGLYYYDNNVIEIAKNLQPSARGELEITDVNNIYLQNNQLEVEILSRETIWLDAGTPSSLLDASNLIQNIEETQSIKIGCPEETAWRLGFIDDEELQRAGNLYAKTDYGQYLLNLLLDASIQIKN